MIRPTRVQATVGAAGPVVLAQPPDPDIVRRTTEEVLSQPEYTEVVEGRTLLDQVLGAVGEQLGRLLLRFSADGGDGSIWASLALIGIVLALATALVVFLRRLRRGAVQPTALAGPVGRPAADWGAEADAHAAAGRWREAMRCRYRQSIAELAAAGLVDEIPGRTTGEYRRAVSRAVPAAAEAFGDMTDRFDRAWYGGEAVDAAGSRAFDDDVGRLRAAVPGQRRPVGAGVRR